MPACAILTANEDYSMKRSFYFGANVTLLATAALGVVALASGTTNDDKSVESLAFSALPAESLDGESVTLLDSARPTVFLIMSPRCAIAADAVPDWAVSLGNSLPRVVRLVVLAFDTDGADVVAQYLEQRQLYIETVVVPRDLFIASTGMTIVPSVILVDEGGKIVFTREGKTEVSALRDEILAKLPMATAPEA
jgi:hypothetical protein